MLQIESIEIVMNLPIEMGVNQVILDWHGNETYSHPTVTIHCTYMYVLDPKYYQNLVLIYM